MSWFSDFMTPPAANIPPPNLTNYQPQNMGGADSSAFGGIGNLGNFNLYQGLIPQAQGVTNNLVNNPGIPSWLQGAQDASSMGAMGANNAFGAGGGLMSLGSNIAGTAFDPQNALYGRTVQQLQDQTRAGEAARGIAMTPYGAGLENQALSNFNIDWNNNQLNRQIMGGQAAGSLIGQGAGLQAGAPGQLYSSSSLPYQTNLNIGQGQFGALSNLGGFGQQGSQIPQQQVADYLNYLGWGTGAQNAGNSAALGGFNAALNQNNQAFNQQGSIFGGIGKALGGLWGTSMPGGSTLGGTLLAGLGLSDERLKEDIHEVGRMHDGLPVYSYRYRGDPTPRMGLMAQDVEKVRPDAVHDIGGFKAVDYGKATEWSRGIAALSAWG